MAVMRFPEKDIPAAAFLFEQARGRVLGEYERSEIQRAGLESGDADAIAHMLRLSLGDQDAGYCRSVYWALGKRCDVELIPFFKERLAMELERDVEGVYQIMITLEDTGERVFSPARSSHSVLDGEMNRADAVRYLKSGAEMTGIRE